MWVPIIAILQYFESNLGMGHLLDHVPPTKHQKADNTFTLLSTKAAAFLPGHVLQKSACVDTMQRGTRETYIISGYRG